MTKRLLAIYLVLVLLIALLVPSCAGGAKCTIYVKATLCGLPWQGTVNYTLTPTTGSPVSGTAVPSTHSVACGTWTCGSVSGGPPGAFLKSITPLATQTVTGGNITFTLDFELNQDAAIEFVTWTIDGDKVDPNTPGMPYPVGTCHVIDVKFNQRVNGCDGYNVTVNETSLLNFHWTEYLGGFPPGIVLEVVNNACAVNKTVSQMPPPQKSFQVPSVNGTPLMPPYEQYHFMPNICENWTLDVNTQWHLVKGLNYTKSINWFGISFVEGRHGCVLFELLPQVPGTYFITLIASAEVKLVGAQDVNPGNNKATSPPLYLAVLAP